MARKLRVSLVLGVQRVAKDLFHRYNADKSGATLAAGVVGRDNQPAEGSRKPSCDPKGNNATGPPPVRAAHS